MANTTVLRIRRDTSGGSCPGPIADLLAVYRGARGEIVKLVSVDERLDTVVVVLEVAKG